MRLTRRTLMLAASITPLIACEAEARAATLHVAPDGEGQGGSWDDAANLYDLVDLIAALKPGGEILIAADRGAYTLTEPVLVNRGGRRNAPARVRGVNSETGASQHAVIRGARGEDGEQGPEGFRLLRGADHLHFSFLDFRIIGDGCFRVGDAISNLTIEDCRFEDVYRFLETYESGNARDASLRNFAVRRCTGTGAARAFARLGYTSRDGLFEDCRARGVPHAEGDIPVGCALEDRVSNITFRRCVMENFQQLNAGEYWNGDGFSDEEDNQGIRYEACEARGSTDGGFDCKSRGVVLENCIAEDNKRNFRIWSEDATLIGCTSRNPNFRGAAEEIASPCHLWIGSEGESKVEVSNFTVEDRDSVPILEFEHEGPRVEIRGVTIHSPRQNWGERGAPRAGSGVLIVD